MSDFENEVLNDLGRYRETEEAVAQRAYFNLLKQAYQPFVDCLNLHHAEYQSIGADLAKDDLIHARPPQAMRISLRLKPDGIKAEK